MSALGMLLIGAGLTVLARMFGGRSRRGSFGAWQSPPPWVRVLFGAHRDCTFLDDAIVQVVGMVWLLAGGALLVTGQSSGSATFGAVETALVLCFLAGGVAALLIWFVREYIRR